MNTIISLYRAWPWRPHCNSAAGIHAWTCTLAFRLGFLGGWGEDNTPFCAGIRGEPQVPNCRNRK